METFQISNILASKVLAVSIFSFIDKSPNMLQSGMILHICIYKRWTNSQVQISGKSGSRYDVDMMQNFFFFCWVRSSVLVTLCLIMHCDVVHTRFIEIDQEVFVCSSYDNLWKYNFVLRALQSCSNFHVVKFHHNGCMEIAFIAIFPQIFTSYFLSLEFLYFLVRFVFIQNSRRRHCVAFSHSTTSYFPPISVCLFVKMYRNSYIYILKPKSKKNVTLSNTIYQGHTVLKITI